MRSLLSRRRVARQPRTGASTLLKSFLTVSSLASIPVSHAINFTSVPDSFLDLDIASLGRVGFAGDFAGLSLYQFEGQDEDPFRTNGSEGLLARLPNGVLTTVVQADASIQSMCNYVADGVPQGVIIAGNFTSLGDRESTGIALFNPNTTEVRQLPGIQGSVNAVLCDNDTVYVGGNFMGIENSTNAVSWATGTGFTALPFAGFNGPVLSIAKASNGHIIFGGSFTGLGNASTPSTPDEQVINLSTANLTSGSTTTTTGFDQPSNIVCKTSGDDGAGNTWLLADNTAGFWQANMGFGYRPTKLRLYNTHQDGRGTKTWRFTALPINGIMNLTYIDPETKQNLTCTSECPLSSDTNVTFQEFHFVNVIGMNGFRIDISDWYGSGGGLNGIELFQDDIFSFAVSDFNEPSCAGISTASNATQTGPWTVSSTFANSSRYLTAQLSSPITTDSASVVFFPDIRESGYYTVNMYTPGCLQDDTCDSRGQVHLSGTMSPTTGTNGSISTSLFQTNNFDKYDPIYYGYVDATSSSFRPAVTLTPASGQSLSQQTIVAQRVGFVLYNTTGGLNGLFEYDPSVTSFNSSDFQNSVYDKLGMNFSTGSAVNALATSGTVTFIGGNFTSSASSNIVSIDQQDSSVRSLDGGLDGFVASMHVNGTKLFVGGSFNNTQTNDASGLANIAVFDTSSNTWSALGSGVNGPVSAVVPLTMNISGTTEEVVSFTGNFSQLNAFEGNQAVLTDGFGVWVPSQGNWLVNLDGPVEYLDGMLTTSVLDVTGSNPLYAGTVVSSTLGAVGAASLSGSEPDFGLDDFGARIQRNSSSTFSSLKRDILNGSASGVIDGAFLNKDDLNITVLAGRFTLTGSNGSTIHNVAIVNSTDGDNATITGFASGISQDSTFVAVAIQDSKVFAGGNVTGLVSGTNVSGLVSFDLKANDYGSQPPALEGGSATVSAIAVRPNSGDVFVGGSFTSAGSLGCPAVCSFSSSSAQWTRPGNNLLGEARAMAWVTDELLVAGGNFSVNGSTSYLVSYTSGAQSWENYPGGTQLPGPVDVIVAGSAKGDQVWITGTATNGSIYLMKYDGSNWKSAGQPFEAGTDIRSLQVFTLTESKGSSDLLDETMSLMLTGHIVIPAFGSASAALFNGTALTPFALTTKAGNTAGTISRVFVEKTNFFSSSSSGSLPIYAIVLIGLAIALGLTLLIVVAGMAMERLRKKREGYQPAPTSMFDRGSGMQRIPPHELLESLGKGRPGAPHV